MELRILAKSELEVFVFALAGRHELFGPVGKDGAFSFERVDSLGEMSLDYPYTTLPPKNFLLPQEEVLLKYDLTTSTAEPVIDSPNRVVFGVHSCDMHGIWLLDDVFAEGAYDAHYFSRRRGTRFVGIDCKSPCSANSFCRDMDTLLPAGAYDLFLTDMGESYAVQSGSESGDEMLRLAGFRKAGFKERDRFLDIRRRKMEEFPLRLEYPSEMLPVTLTEAYDDFIWDALEERCYDCASCTVVCPTCYCFDVFDRNAPDAKSGVRCRKWDSCHLKGFAALAGGENMRGKRSDRLRHRMLRKGKYFKEKYDRFACVGCGRCGRTCLVGIDILQVFNQLKG